MINEKLKSGIYIIEDIQRGLFKIGCSKDIKKRIKTVIKTCRFSGIKTELQVFNIIYVKNYRILEKHLHLLAKKYHYQGEWYKCSEDDINSFLIKIELSYYNR